MGKKKENSILQADKQIISYAKELAKSKPGKIKYRLILNDIKRWICIREGLKLLKDMGEL